MSSPNLNFDPTNGFSDKLEALKKIHSFTTLKSDLDTIIKDTLDDLKVNNSHRRFWVSSSSVVSKMRRKLNKLVKKYNIEQEFLELYLSLDKSLYLALKGSGSELSIKEITVEKLPKPAHKCPANKFISAYTFGTIFNKNEGAKLSFLLEHKELFPDSSLKFIEKKILERENTPKLSNLKNSFGLKSFECTLDNKADVAKLKVALNAFSKTKEIPQKTLNFIFFRKAIENKYKNCEEDWEILVDINKTLNNKISTNLMHTLNLVDSGANGAEDMLKKIAVELRNDDDLSLAMINNKSRSTRDENILFNFITYVSKSEAVHELIRLKMSNYLRDNARLFFFNYRFASKNVTDAILDDSKEQFLITNKNFHWLKDF